MKVELINCTGYGTSDPARHAANVLVFTKGTRLNMSAGRMAEIQAMPWSKMEEELAYMANTIPSSWEMVDYTFLITDVTRAFTHQFVRTRQGSYAQQTMRVLNKHGWTYGTGPSIEAGYELHPADGSIDGMTREAELYHDTMATVAAAYDELVAGGIAIEDARGILPTNIHTNIVAKFNLRTLCEMFRKRASGRTQGEYRDVIEAMKAEVLKVHPWSKLFVDRSFDAAAAELEAMIRSLNGTLPAEEITNMVKKIDQMRMQA